LEWTKATIKTTSAGVEIISALLMDMGIYGIEIDDPVEMAQFFANTSHQWDYIDEEILGSPFIGAEAPEASLTFYVGTDSDSIRLLTQVSECLKAIQEPVGSLATAIETVNDQNWLHEWKKHFHPIKIGNVLIVPEWEDVSSNDEIIFTIDPGSAFGTGQHATTMLCIEALQSHLAQDGTVLDIGCGSGILSIISLLLGAKNIVACDIDPAAVEISKKNAALNPINAACLEVHTGDILTSKELLKTIKRQSYNVIVANIVADVIISLASIICIHLAPSGKFIASGIITERLADVQLALTANNLIILEVKHSEGWCCIIATIGNESANG